ncbi:MAG: helix-turn-helix domain-containing protein [Acidimicrobiia bacterium]
MTVAQPPEIDPQSETLADAPGALAEFLRRHPTPTARVVLVSENSADDPTTVTVPSEALKMFIEILDHLNDGVGVSVVPANADLTTQQAADLLGVSRPYLIDKVLVPDGPIPYRTVGRHRRIRFADIDEFRREDLRRRKEAADRVTRIAIDAGMDD